MQCLLWDLGVCKVAEDEENPRQEKGGVFRFLCQDIAAAEKVALKMFVWQTDVSVGDMLPFVFRGVVDKKRQRQHTAKLGLD